MPDLSPKAGVRSVVIITAMILATGPSIDCRILEPAIQPIEPESPIWVEHDLDNAVVIEPPRHAKLR